MIPGKFVQQINLEIGDKIAAIREGIVEIRRESALRKAIGYVFCSDELQELAAVMFGALSLDD